MAEHLLPCPRCARHVLASATTCPFCSTALTLSTTKRARWTRATRVAAFALNASLVTSFACSDDASTKSGGVDPVDAAARGDASRDARTDADIDPCCDGPIYGAPLFDAYVDDSPIDASDAATLLDAADAGDSSAD